MIIGVPKEVKDNEFRVGIVPGGVEELVLAGHQVLIEKGAGQGSGISDRDFKEAGARIVARKRDLFKHADLILKVKEPQISEYRLIRPGQILFCYFHFAASRSLTAAILKSKAVTAVECLRYALSLPTSVVITGIDSMKILDQAFEAVRTFQPMSHDQLTALLDRTRSTAAEGSYELFKTTNRFDATAQHPEWLGSPPQPA